MKHTTSLKKNKDFQYVYQNGVSKANRHLVIYVLSNESKENRLGISVSKKVGNSVVRHRITRLIREAYRLNEDRMQTGLDIIYVARPAAKDISYAQTEADLIHLAKLCRITGAQ